MSANGKGRPSAQETASHQETGKVFRGYGTANTLYRDAGWSGVLTLQPRTKWSPEVRGVTGRDGRWPTDEEMDSWAVERADWNVASRVPHGIVALDVDDYGTKQGGKTLAKLEGKLGPLPATWRSTSRPDDPVSGIRWFRVPEDREFHGKVQADGTSDIEVIQFHHRYAVVWPSIHPEGRPYVWFTPWGNLVDEVPDAMLLPELPAEWVEYLDAGSVQDGMARAAQEINLGEAREWLTDGESCDRVATKLGEYQSANGSRHDSMISMQVALLGLGEQGHHGVAKAVEELRERFVTDVTPDRDGGQSQAEYEFQSALHGAAGQVTTKTEHKGCCPTTFSFDEFGIEPKGEEQDQGEPEDDSWRPVDLSAVVRGEYERPRPSIGRRSDGVPLLYPSREHAVASEPEAGKTWLLCQVVVDELAADGRVVYVDFEDDEAGIGSRLLDLGAEGQVLLDRARFRYVRPVEPVTGEKYRALLRFDDLWPTLVILDGVTEGYGLHGWKIDGNDDSPQWRKIFIRPATSLGAATFASDHVVKNPENRRGFAIGAQHKKAGLTGALFGLVNVTPLGRGLLGRSRLVIYKDRPGGLRQHGVRQEDGYVHLADLMLDARGAGLVMDDDGSMEDAITLEIRPPVEVPDGGPSVDPILETVNRIKEVLTARGPLSSTDLRAATRGSVSKISEAVQYMIGTEELHEGKLLRGSAKLRHLPDQCREGMQCYTP